MTSARDMTDDPARPGIGITAFVVIAGIEYELDLDEVKIKPDWAYNHNRPTIAVYIDLSGSVMMKDPKHVPQPPKEGKVKKPTSLQEAINLYEGVEE